ncbi:hypothetical protein CYY_002737 [Polysphondylium violaceum]|uniref:RRM domain-containing protein n=1 Tax=Polysphondylium violaceum TaxID=133409 RepID=A0A8J4PY17_9MYCE|nr:hypothetical protein CYY_002737 [Polysphondylium violaceum]
MNKKTPTTTTTATTKVDKTKQSTLPKKSFKSLTEAPKSANIPSTPALIQQEHDKKRKTTEPKEPNVSKVNKKNNNKDSKPTKTNKKDNNNNNKKEQSNKKETTTPTKPKDNTKAKEQPNKRQKTTNTKPVEPTKPVEIKPTTTTTTITTPTTPTPTPTPTFSIFDSLKGFKSEETGSKSNTSTTATATTTTTKTNENMTSTKPSIIKKKNVEKINNSNTQLLKAFENTNTFSSPDIEAKNKIYQEILTTVKEQQPDEVNRKLQREKTKLKKDSAKSREEQDPRTVFISNLNLENAKTADVKKIFKEYGDIESIRFRSFPVASENANRKETFIKKEFHEKRETCNAYVVFKLEKDAKRAAEAVNGQEHFGKHLRVDMANHKPTKESDEKTVFLGNIPYECEEEEIFLLFEKSFGDVLSVRLVRDSHTNIGKGFGYVVFKQESSAKEAIASKAIIFGKREIRIFPTKANPKKGKTIKQKKRDAAKRPSTRTATTTTPSS